MINIGYCYHPLKGFYLGTKANGKRNFKVTSYDVDHLEKFGELWIPQYDGYKSFNSSNGRPYVDKYIEIPCGRCIGCRLQRSREWANRLMMELQYYEKAIFLTLTYDDEHLHIFEGVQPETGEIIKTPGLVLEDLQKFIKDLRNKYRGEKIRYFACGEYGDRYQRPHYHLIIFGYKPDDAVFEFRSNMFNYFKSAEISELWSNGLHLFSDVSWDTCAYTARYVTKKLYGEESEKYDLKNIRSPFCIMSTRPGIGFQWYQDHKDMFRDDQRIYYMASSDRSISFNKPRYFKKLDSISGFIPGDSDTFLNVSGINIRDSFELASDQEMQRRIQSLSTDLEYTEQLLVEEKYKEQQTKVLKREVF